MPPCATPAQGTAPPGHVSQERIFFRQNTGFRHRKRMGQVVGTGLRTLGGRHEGASGHTPSGGNWVFHFCFRVHSAGLNLLGETLALRSSSLKNTHSSPLPRTPVSGLQPGPREAEGGRCWRPAGEAESKGSIFLDQTGASIWL